jgi:hypothetical protein
MKTFSISFKTALFSSTIRENIQAKHIKEAVQRLREMHKNVFILSYMQIV